MSDYEHYDCKCGRQHPVGVVCAIGKRTFSARAVKAYWETDISTAMDIVIRLSDNDRYDSHKFVREVIRKLKPWSKP